MTHPRDPTVNFVATAKAYFRAKCVTSESTRAEGGCTARILKEMNDAYDFPDCAAVFSDEVLCRLDPYLINETCALKVGRAEFGVEDSVIKAIRAVGV